MPDRTIVSLLNAHLWSLRAEVESQLRTLTQVHREIDSLPRPDDPRRETEVSRLVADIERILDANLSIRTLCMTALEEARALVTERSEQPSSSGK